MEARTARVLAELIYLRSSGAPHTPLQALQGRTEGESLSLAQIRPGWCERSALDAVEHEVDGHRDHWAREEEEHGRKGGHLRLGVGLGLGLGLGVGSG